MAVNQNIELQLFFTIVGIEAVWRNHVQKLLPLISGQFLVLLLQIVDIDLINWFLRRRLDRLHRRLFIASLRFSDSRSGLFDWSRRFN